MPSERVIKHYLLRRGRADARWHWLGPLRGGSLLVALLLGLLLHSWLRDPKPCLAQPGSARFPLSRNVRHRILNHPASSLIGSNNVAAFHRYFRRLPYADCDYSTCMYDQRRPTYLNGYKTLWLFLFTRKSNSYIGNANFQFQLMCSWKGK